MATIIRPRTIVEVEASDLRFVVNVTLRRPEQIHQGDQLDLHIVPEVSGAEPQIIRVDVAEAHVISSGGVGGNDDEVRLTLKAHDTLEDLPF